MILELSKNVLLRIKHANEKLSPFSLKSYYLKKNSNSKSPKQ